MTRSETGTTFTRLQTKFANSAFAPFRAWKGQAWRREAQTVYPTEEEEEKEVTAAASSQPSDSSQAPPELAKARLASPKSFKAKELVLPWRQTTPAAGKREAPVVPRLTVHGARAPSVMPHQLTHNERV